MWLLKHCDYYVGAIALICLYAILQIKFDFAFWLGRSENAGKWNEIITNISYSYLAGFFFYLLTVTLPHRKMKAKVKRALDSKLNAIRSNYRACVESVLPPLETMPLTISKEETIENFKTVSFFQKCKISYFQNAEVSVVDYIKFKHQENIKLATDLLEYKPWLSSESIAQIEEIRNSDLHNVIISLTQTVAKDHLDNEDGRGMLAGLVYDMWTLAKSIKC